MSDLPDFIQPTSFSPSKIFGQMNPQNSHNDISDPINSALPSPVDIQTSKPNSLPEFLRLNATKYIEKLTAVQSASELLSKLNPQQTLWLDLEINPENEKLIDGAFLINNYYWHFNRPLAKVISQARN